MDIAKFGSFVRNSLELANVKTEKLDFGISNNLYARIKTNKYELKLAINYGLLVLRTLKRTTNEITEKFFMENSDLKAFENFGQITDELINIHTNS